MAKAIEVAQYIVDVIEVTPLKLQKLLYYTQAVCLVRYGKPAFEDTIEAWDYGPVIPAVYDRFRNTKAAVKISPRIPINLDPDVMLSADIVIDYYGKMDGPALIRETHSEAPWRNAYREGKNNPISNEEIKTYYKTIFSFSDLKPNHRGKTRA